jgi:hypothetical protein
MDPTIDILTLVAPYKNVLWGIYSSQLNLPHLITFVNYNQGLPSRLRECAIISLATIYLMHISRLYGITLLQSYYYYSHAKDGWILKTTVSFAKGR